ncbi:unnamed protein product [Closterium sp. NIES-53]
MTLRPSTAPQRVPLLSPPASSLPASPDPESDSLRAASPAVTRFLATAVTDPLFESSAASALITELFDFAAACRLDYAASLVDAYVSVCPPSVGGECALGTDVLEGRQEEFECFGASVPHLVYMPLAPEGDPDALDIPTPRSYPEAIEDEVPPPGANIVSGMWIFRVKRPPGSPPAFKARYVARGFSQRRGVDFFQTFSPTPKMTTLRVLLHAASHLDYELHSLDFSTAFLQGSLHEEIWLRRPPGFTGSFPAGTQWSLRRPVYGLCQAPREWHDTLRTTLASLGFAPSTADPSLLFRTDTTMLPFYVLVYVDDLVFATADTEALAHMKAQRTITLTPSHMVQQVLQRFGFTYSSPQSTPLPTGHSLSAPPSDESVEPSGPTSGMGLVLGGRARVVLTGHADASWVDDLATQRSSQGCTFSLGSDYVSWQSTRSSFVLSSREAPRSPPVLYVDNKAMLALCQEHRLEHRTKHIALRYFLARELQQRGQLRLAYVASQANTADVFTKALQHCDHQPCFVFLDWSYDLLFSPTLPMGSLVASRRSAPRASQVVDTMRTTLAAPGFAPATADPSLFLCTDTSLPPFYVLVYVDDLVFATAETEALTLVKSELQKRHTCTDLGEQCSYLGLQITQDRAQCTITLTHGAPEPSAPYPELVGFLMYLMTCTLPDLAYPLCLLARYVAPGRHRKVHWDAAKRVLCYLCSTSGMGLVLGGWGPVVLTGHADASVFDDLATQRSSQGYTFSLGSGSVSWQSTRSSSVLSSSCEAEFYAGAMAAQELRWLTYLLTDLGEQPCSPPVLTKHIALRYFLARELQQRGQLRLAYVASRANTADIFTKALPPGDHQRFSIVLGIVPTLPHLLNA